MKPPVRRVILCGLKKYDINDSIDLYNFWSNRFCRSLVCRNGRIFVFICLNLKGDILHESLQIFFIWEGRSLTRETMKRAQRGTQELLVICLNIIFLCVLGG